jgi:hypothetical protein
LTRSEHPAPMSNISLRQCTPRRQRSSATGADAAERRRNRPARASHVRTDAPFSPREKVPRRGG